MRWRYRTRAALPWRARRSAELGQTYEQYAAHVRRFVRRLHFARPELTASDGCRHERREKQLISYARCTVRPEIRPNGPGTRRACGMTLEPDVAAVPASKTEYTCPKHPHIGANATWGTIRRR